MRGRCGGEPRPVPRCRRRRLRLALFRFGRAARERLLDVFQGKLQLVGVEFFGAPAELHPLQLAQQLTQPIVLLGQHVALSPRRVALGGHATQQVVQRFNVLGKGIGQNHHNGATGS